MAGHLAWLAVLFNFTFSFEKREDNFIKRGGNWPARNRCSYIARRTDKEGI